MITTLTDVRVEELVRKDPKHLADKQELARALYNLLEKLRKAQSLEDAGRLEDALVSWKRALDLNPKSKQASARVRALARKMKGRK